MSIHISDNYIGYSNGGTLSPLFYGRYANQNNYFPLRNRIINGNFIVNQISPTITPVNVTTRYFTIDRWWTLGTVGSKFSTQVVADGPTPTTVYYSSRRGGNIYPGTAINTCVEIKSLASTTLGATDSYTFGQNIEGRHIADMQFGTNTNLNYIMLSFWSKASQTGSYSVCLQNSAQNRRNHQLFTVGTANSWEYQELWFTVDQTGTWLNDINTGLRVVFNLGAGTSNRGTTAYNTWATTSTELASSSITSIHLVNTLNATLRLTGIQVELVQGGAQSRLMASPFETRGFQQELDLCKRYFQKSWAYGTDPGTQTTYGMRLHTDLQLSSVQHYQLWRWPVPMRAAPTVQVYGYASPGNAGYCYAWGNSISGLGDYTASTAGVSRYGAMFYMTASVTHTMTGYHFKADAEPT